jgi:hypothetical protein
LASGAVIVRMPYCEPDLAQAIQRAIGAVAVRTFIGNPIIPIIISERMQSGCHSGLGSGFHLITDLSIWVFTFLHNLGKACGSYVPIQSVTTMLKDTPITPPEELTKHESSDFRQVTRRYVCIAACLRIDESGRMPCERGTAPH